MRVRTPTRPTRSGGRRPHRLEPDPATAERVRWMFAQRLAGHSVASIARALNERGVACPSTATVGGQVANLHPDGGQIDAQHVAAYLREHNIMIICDTGVIVMQTVVSHHDVGVQPALFKL